jgi:hypothetical protein
VQEALGQARDHAARNLAFFPRAARSTLSVARRRALPGELVTALLIRDNDGPSGSAANLLSCDEAGRIAAIIA